MIRVVRCHRGALAGRDLRAELLLHRRDPLQPAVHVGYGAWRRGGAGWRWAGYRRLRQSGRRRVQSLLGEGRLVVVQIFRRQRLVVELELPSRLPAPTAATDFHVPSFNGPFHGCYFILFRRSNLEILRYFIIFIYCSVELTRLQKIVLPTVEKNI